MLYPLLQEIGITPIRIDDMLMPGDNWMDIARMTISKSNMAIVDISDNNPNVMYELGLIQAQKNQNMIIIAEVGSATTFLNDHILTYKYDWGNNSENEHIFKHQLKQACHRIISNDKTFCKPFEDANRLFVKAEYSSCIISAFSELELLFQKRHAINAFRASLPAMLKELVENGEYSKSIYRDVQDHWSLRNKIIHSGYKANRDEAKNALEFASKFNQREMDREEQNLN